jgi:hypothetical protein
MTTVAATARLLNPGSYDAAGFDPATQRLLRATIDWFEAKGKARITTEIHSDEWRTSSSSSRASRPSPRC